MKLGELLIRDGRLTEEQIQRAVARQALVGGRLGTVLYEMQLLDLDELTVYLGVELSMPVATGAALERAKRLAVRLLAPQQAARYRCVPLLIQDRQLIAALDDPHDMQRLDALAQLTGYRIIPRVAPEIRIYYYLERYYGVSLPQRFSVFADALRGSKLPKRNLPAPPLPGLPPLREAPVAAPSRPPPLRPVAQASFALLEDPEAIELDAHDLLVELEADDTEPARRVEGAQPLRDSGPTRLDEAAAEQFDPCSLQEAQKRMRAGTQRSDVARGLLCYAASVFDVAALCIVRENIAFGWKVVGPDLEADRIETLLLPLDAPSMFQTALHDEQHQYSGAPFPATLHNYLYRVLRSSPPRLAFVHAIAIGPRTVNILYGQRETPAELSDGERRDLLQACAEASRAYVRLIALLKRGHSGDQASDSRSGQPAPRRIVLGDADGPPPPEVSAYVAASAQPGHDDSRPIRIMRAKSATEDAAGQTPTAPSEQPSRSQAEPAQTGRREPEAEGGESDRARAPRRARTDSNHS